MLTSIRAFSGFSVNDLNKARDFYIDKLALKVVDDNMGLDLELPGGGRVFIYEKPDHQPAAFTILNFVVENISETVDHLGSEHGISFLRYDNMPGQQDEKGIMRGKAVNMGPDIAWFTDPAGNILSVIEN